MPPIIAATVAWSSIGSLVATALAIMGSPGPATVSLTAAGAAFGIRRSVAYLAGIVVGTIVVLVAVASGITAALLAVPGLRIVLLGLAALYLLQLAYRIATAPPVRREVEGHNAPSLLGGTTLGIANPKAWFAIAATFASTRLSEAPVTDAFVKVVVLTPTIAAFMTLWLVAGASLAPLLRKPRPARVVNVTLALALVTATVLALVH